MIIAPVPFEKGVSSYPFYSPFFLLLVDNVTDNRRMHNFVNEDSRSAKRSCSSPGDGRRRTKAIARGAHAFSAEADAYVKAAR